MEFIQEKLFEKIRTGFVEREAFGACIADVLNISSDAAYRRLRNETSLTIEETKTLCKHFKLSFDQLCDNDTHTVCFNYQPLNSYDEYFESYLENVLSGLKKMRAAGNPQLTLTVSNVQFLQMLNFPHLIRFKFCFWAKTHLDFEAYKNKKFKWERPSEKAFQIAREIILNYSAIPSKEIYDPMYLKGFIRQIFYYVKACYFEDKNYALVLLDHVQEHGNHLKKQAELSKKYIYGTQAPAEEGLFQMYVNDTINISPTFYYSTDLQNGLYMAHNNMNFLETSDENYVKESKVVIDKQLNNSSLISSSNESERNQFFNELDQYIETFRKKIELV